MTAGYLIVRRGGTLWGLPADQVSSIVRVEPGGRGFAPASVQQEDAEPPARSGFELQLAGGGSLAVDAVLTLAGELRIHPVTPRLRRFLPHGSSGLAMHAGEPLLLLAREAEVAHV